MTGWRKLFFRLGGGLIFVLATTSALVGQSVEAVQKAATEWARIRSESVRAETEWRWQKAFLTSTYDALTERLRVLEGRRDYLEATAVRERGSATEIGLKNEEAIELLRDAQGRVRTLGARLIDLRPWLPPRLSEALEFSFRSLEDPSLSISERMQTAATVFNRCSRFNRAITYSEEMRVVEEGQGVRLLSVIYWGLSHAYALDNEEGLAFYGSPGADGWVWEPKRELGSAVVRLMMIHHEETDPEFVEVPARIADPIGLSAE